MKSFGSTALFAVAVAFTAACSSKSSVVEPPPVVPGHAVVVGNRVQWTTDRDARSTVRYSYTRGSWDHIAYPNARGRVDRSERRTHDIALLDMRPGQKVFYQTVSDASGQAPVYTPVDSFVPPVPAPGALLVSTMIHIGFGDSHLITMPTTGKRFLLDSGGPGAPEAVITYLQSHGVTSLDAMMLTHPHPDHMGGAVGEDDVPGDGILDVFTPAVFFDSPTKQYGSGESVYSELLAELDTATERVVISRGQSAADVPALRLDPEVAILVLNSGTAPGYQGEGHRGTDVNNESMVLRFTYGDVDFVIGGDCENQCERLSIAAFPAGSLDVEFYKAQHHGLPDANSAVWFSALRPRVVFIPNTDLTWSGNVAEAISFTTRKATDIGSDIYAIDDAVTLDRPRSRGWQHNVSFVTDGDSYEIRVEVATQPILATTAESFECFEHTHGTPEHTPETP